MTDRTTKQVLLEAAAILERDGWCQGRYGRAGGHCCALGAINSAIGGSPDAVTWPASAQSQLNYELKDHVGHRLRNVIRDSIVAWNDREGRTASEVIAKLREAAGASP